MNEPSLNPLDNLDPEMMDYLDKLSIISNEIKHSVASVNANDKEDSVSLSSIYSSISSDSEGIVGISERTKHLADLVNSRLTAFIFMSQQCYERGVSNPKGSQELEGLKNILNEALGNYNQKDSKREEIMVKHIFQQIICLQREYNYMEARLNSIQDEVKETEEEETRLKDEIVYIENNIEKFVVETHQIPSSSCNCLVI